MTRAAIVHVVGYYPPHLGGVEQRVQEVALLSIKAGHKVSVLTSDIDVRAGTDNKVANLTVHRLRSFILANTPIMPALFTQLLKVPRSSIIHLHIAQAYAPEITWLATKVTKTPYVAQVRIDAQPESSAGFLLPFYKKVFLKRVLRSASKVICLTPDYETLMQEKYGIAKNKILIVPNGTNFSRASSEKKLMVKNKLQLLYVGRLSAQKNVLFLLKSVKLYHDQYNPNFLLSIIGEGPHKKRLTEFVVANKMHEYVVFLGRKAGKRLERDYAQAHIFILPSREESFGTVIIEAMSKALPVVATDIPAVRNIVQDKENGLLVELNNSEAMAEAINLLASNSKLYSTLSRNALKASRQYNLPSVMQKLESVYAQVAHQ